MAECFCGCGRKIGFGPRGMNKHGRRTAELIRTLEDDVEPVESSAPLDPEIPNETIVGRLREHITAGKEFEDAWRCAAHDEGDDLIALSGCGGSSGGSSERSHTVQKVGKPVKQSATPYRPSVPCEISGEITYGPCGILPNVLGEGTGHQGRG